VSSAISAWHAEAVTKTGSESLIDEKRTRFLKHLVEFRCRHFSNRVKNDVVFDGEESLRTNEALMGELAAFKIGTILPLSSDT